MGLLRGIARTAVIAGTATAVSNRVSRRQAGRWAAQDQAAAPPEPPYTQEPPQYAQQPQYAPPPAAPAEKDTGAMIEQLKELAALRDQGVLTDAEFREQKVRIMG